MGVETTGTISHTSGSVEIQVPDEVKKYLTNLQNNDILFIFSTPLIENLHVQEVVRKAGHNLISPKVGMTFQSEEEAYEMYNTYTGKVGLSIRKSKTKHRRDGSLCQKYIVCSNQGHRQNESS
jgi:hypothetical protein